MGQVKVDVNINDGNSMVNIATNLMVINELPDGVDILIGQDIAELADLIINVQQRKIYIASIPAKFEKARGNPDEKDELSFTDSRLTIETKSSSVMTLTLKDGVNERSNSSQLFMKNSTEPKVHADQMNIHLLLTLMINGLIYGKVVIK